MRPIVQIILLSLLVTLVLSKNCKKGQRKCPNEEKCVPDWYFCDGIADCANGTDEEYNQCKDTPCFWTDDVRCPSKKGCVHKDKC